MRRSALLVPLAASVLLVGVSPPPSGAQSSTVPPPGAPSCEQSLEAAQLQNIQLRKENAQAQFRAAAIEEQAMTLQKQLSAELAKTKAAEKK